MALTQKTVVDQIEVTRNSSLQIRIALEVLNGETIANSKWHRTSIPPGGEVAAQMAAVNAHLFQMGEPPVSEADIAKITAHAETAWTPDVIAAYQAAMAAV